MAAELAQCGFTFCLTKHARLVDNSQGHFLVSEVPLRMLRLNQSLFRILGRIQRDSLSGVVRSHPEVSEERLVQVLLHLTSMGYLSLERIAPMEDYPNVSIIIPVKNQPADLFDCVKSLLSLEYPRDKLQIIVVDDGSSKDASDVIDGTGAEVIRREYSEGAAACRNIGAEKASGEILAFVDADCVPGKNWLKEIVPFFEIRDMGVVGGFVGSYYRTSGLDRYEEVFSSLNLGRRVIFDDQSGSNFYVPSCNMLVRRKAFLAIGGFKGGMLVGEDVDFCWRMRDLGYALLYVPWGSIDHKHRNRLFKMLRRRTDYGTSEGPLYSAHKNKHKRFYVPLWAGLSFLALLSSVLLLSPYPLALIVPFLILDLYWKSAMLKRLRLATPLIQRGYSVLRSHFGFWYHISFHLVRYYFIALLALGVVAHSVWLFSGLALLLTSMVDYRVRRPRLLYPVFLFFYVAEQLAYQIGVFWGCLGQRNFRAYIPEFHFR